jgi:hypothetical protein
MLPSYEYSLINSAIIVYMLPSSAAPGTTKLISPFVLSSLLAGQPPNSLKSQYPVPVKPSKGLSPSESSKSKRANESPP